MILRHTDAGRRILLDAIDVMTTIEAEYGEQIGGAQVAELKRLLALLLARIDPAGTLKAPPVSRQPT